jgi:hypothetical protein
MKQVLIETIPFNVSPIQLTEGLKAPSGNPMVEGILATAEVKNGNGRYYPREIWDKEIDRYQTVVKENRATGELDHPECFIEGYKIQTQEKGWIEFKELDGSEHVATLNKETKELEFQPILKVINQPYSGDIINIESKTFQANVTPNHRFIVENYDKSKLIFKTAEDLFLSKSNSLIPKISTYTGGITDNITIENEHGKIEIPATLFALFMGWWLAEGWLQHHKTTRGKISKGICLSQTKGKNIKEIDNIFEQLSLVLNKKYSKHYRKNNEIEYYILEHTLYKYLSQFGVCDQKFIPKEIKALNKDNIQLFLDAYLKADGSKQKNQEVYYTTSNQMASDISELINLTGYMSSISEKKLAYEKYLIEGKWVKDFDWYTKKEKYQDKLIENKQKYFTGRTLYSIRRKYSSHYHINDCTLTKTQYDGNIYCISVYNETILVMSPNGSTFWSGNSSIINLKNVSHIIRELWWDGDKVMGKLEILPTVSGNILKALIENNVQVGVSSRGMGSLKEINEGTLEVQDDFELLCFDMVSVPSNPGSWMKLVKEGMEDLASQNINKYYRVNSLITEILCSQGTCPIF